MSTTQDHPMATNLPEWEDPDIVDFDIQVGKHLAEQMCGVPGAYIGYWRKKGRGGRLTRTWRVVIVIPSGQPVSKLAFAPRMFGGKFTMGRRGYFAVSGHGAGVILRLTKPYLTGSQAEMIRIIDSVRGVYDPAVVDVAVEKLAELHKQVPDGLNIAMLLKESKRI